ncbi:uncharacterized protein MYCFIDRAFT_172021 [Pseudocercospora fijiensis CIRAD86]|uniref:Uncharacterized protein n=1 Tax=Pseudocercospora fijiensis (strain CIRAD86) TaxID=383855 RepID=M3BAI9_PSEFD|nr:uncharacterized protein MYCFIDRAFT_172021 [Pseudocercospora fijiensis CIRAD86]EME86243.1 hypothetical protein MYCFIDRAFT_172021 [Pseudocercospora fijiensis CIRAD86]
MQATFAGQNQRSNHNGPGSDGLAFLRPTKRLRCSASSETLLHAACIADSPGATSRTKANPISSYCPAASQPGFTAGQRFSEFPLLHKSPYQEDAPCSSNTVHTPGTPYFAATLARGNSMSTLRTSRGGAVSADNLRSFQGRQKWHRDARGMGTMYVRTASARRLSIWIQLAAGSPKWRICSDRLRWLCSTEFGSQISLIVSQIAVQGIGSEVCGRRCYYANIFIGPSDIRLKRRVLEGQHSYLCSCINPCPSSSPVSTPLISPFCSKFCASRRRRMGFRERRADVSSE